ncbi:MAG TPA: TIGR03435 family protein, partial [Acidobacteriaceae bacterium]|nr:TIGR03435 family protein [Acidobacteriaceae bacterium]
PTFPGGAIMVRSNNTLDLYGTSMSFFATMLTGMAGPGQPTIIDRTGLTGRYNIIVKSIISHAGQSPNSPDATDPEGSVFSAVETLGLKLEPGKVPVETLVIDHIERPSAN